MITRESAVCIRLKEEWMGNPPRKIIMMNKRMADSLFRRDVAEICEKQKPEAIKRKLQRRDQDKMIRSTEILNKGVESFVEN
jgi:hypothetical protein